MTCGGLPGTHWAGDTQEISVHGSMNSVLGVGTRRQSPQTGSRQQTTQKRVFVDERKVTLSSDPFANRVPLSE